MPRRPWTETASVGVTDWQRAMQLSSTYYGKYKCETVGQAVVVGPQIAQAWLPVSSRIATLFPLPRRASTVSCYLVVEGQD